MSSEIATEYSSNVLSFTDIKYLIPFSEAKVEYMDEITPKYLNLLMPDIIVDDKSLIIQIKFKQQLGKGLFGTVLLYESDEKMFRIALKITSDLTEIGIIRNSGDKIQNLLSTKILGQKLIQNTIFYYVALPAMEGSLLNIINVLKQNPVLAIKICLSVTSTLKKLYENDLIYTDLKVENILYRYIGQNTINIVVGDIGGVVQKRVAKFPYTYLPSISNPIIANEELSRWQILYMFLTMLNPEARYGKVPITTDEVFRYIDGITTKNKDLLKKFLIFQFFKKEGKSFSSLEKNFKRLSILLDPDFQEELYGQEKNAEKLYRDICDVECNKKLKINDQKCGRFLDEQEQKHKKNLHQQELINQQTCRNLIHEREQSYEDIIRRLLSDKRNSMEIEN